MKNIATDNMTDYRRKQKGGAEKRRKKLAKEAKNKKANAQMRPLMAQCKKKPAERRLSGAEEPASKQLAFANGGDEAPQPRCTEDLQERTSPPEFISVDEASNEEEHNPRRRSVLNVMKKPARGSKFNYSWCEKFAWLYYDEEKGKAFCKYCVKAHKINKLAEGVDNFARVTGNNSTWARHDKSSITRGRYTPTR